MDKNAKQSYLDWFNSSFTNDEVLLLSKIGIECGADQNFFKYEILDIFGFITNRKLKTHLDLYEKFITRYKQLIPSFLHSQIDETLLREDRYYAAWFFNRHCFLKEQEKAKNSALGIDGFKLRREYVIWCPIDDIYCPEECLFHKNIVYHVLDDEFIEYSINHWMKVKQGCRCALISFTESSVRRAIVNNTCVLSPKLKIAFAQELP
ncbi:hypothetical protein [Acinetobacter wuhouensis]|uniref:Uncharacterized protein n=1 Tax=Acinetobacter wuhouensis TaxID=1879050 RepID=A0A3G2T2J9_9GAMM|nr:hypothetical protein [Acinetobacter wuhouensis]AYO54202.1 hypothetical protein CDG68_11400 [Acinetobacter wuhouensis]